MESPAPSIRILSIIGGTSASAPVFAGVVALLNQYLAGSPSSGLGNINPTLYQLAATPANGAFHQVKTGDNNAYCQAGTPAAQLLALRCPASGTAVVGYSAATADATTGYNLVTGLGSVDINKLAIAWGASRTASSTVLTFAPANPVSGATVTLTATVSSSAKGNVTFKNGSTTLGTAATTNGVATLTTSTLPVAANSITATYNGNGTLSPSTSTAVTVTVGPAFTLTPSAQTYQVAQGSAVDATVTVGLGTGFTGTITFTCTDTASLSVCTVPPATNASGDVSFHITTTAPTAKLDRPMDRGSRIFYAVLMPGLLGLFFTFGSKKRSQNAMRLLGLIAVLSVSTMWMASCGGSGGSGSTSNPGTPKGTYTITVSGASGGSTASTSFQLVVQ